MRSAVDLLHAIGMSSKTAILNRALTSTSCGWLDSGSQKNITMSMLPSTMRLPICKSPPIGPLRMRSTGVPSASAIRLPVVPVAMRLKFSKVSLLYFAQLTRSFFLSSCAISANVNFLFMFGFLPFLMCL